MAVTVLCPHCGGVQSVSAEDASEDASGVEPSVVCVRCQRGFFASEAARPVAPDTSNRPRVLLETECPRCRTFCRVSSTDPSAPVPCHRCGHVFTQRNAKLLRQRTRRRRRKSRPTIPDPAERLILPANALFFFAALELVLFFSGIAWVTVRGLTNPNPVPPPNPAQPIGKTLQVAFLLGLVLFVVRNVFVLLGARQMWLLRSYRRAALGALVALVPVPPLLIIMLLVGTSGSAFLCGCEWLWILGWVAFAIWGLIVLQHRDVRQRFGDPPPPWPPVLPPDQPNTVDHVPAVNAQLEAPPQPLPVPTVQTAQRAEPTDNVPVVHPEPQAPPQPPPPDTTAP